MRGSVVFLLFFVLVTSATSSIVKKGSSYTIPLTKKSNIVKDGIVNINALNKHVISLEYKYANSLANFERNTGKPHPLARAGTTVKRQTGRVPLQNYDDALWYGPIYIGGQYFTVDFDTGSSDLFVPGPYCGASCSGHNIFNTRGAYDTGVAFRLGYEDNSTVTGEVFISSVSVGGLTAQNQAFGVANQYSSGYSISEYPADGLMGMAYPQIAQIKATAPYFNNLIQQRAVASGQFGFKLAANGSTLYLGGVDPSSSSGALNLLPVTQTGFWQVTMDSVNTFGYIRVRSKPAIIDTGTSAVIGDLTSVAQIYASIPGSQDASSTLGTGYYTFPCSSNPKVSMTFGGITYDISYTFNLGLAPGSSTNCVGGIIGRNLGFGAWLVGDVFLQNVYAQFSFTNNTVGFSRQV